MRIAARRFRQQQASGRQRSEADPGAVARGQRARSRILHPLWSRALHPHSETCLPAFEPSQEASPFLLDRPPPSENLQ
ncbi:hypothetical protein NDU88_000998 [Pleurodeles waltl]|uniref:Uncharacterized protein n=1 Tax=Pleurodeles waltl TaxID=8319 RepID=A0AAV7M413_PLEWA|nr:hypothetical protein NDU88_000998 [Pleurodeles waltl]